MPLGVVITGANANDGCQAQDLLEALVIRPPQPEVPTTEVDPRSLPTARADGAYGNGPDPAAGRGGGLPLAGPRPRAESAGSGADPAVGGAVP